MSENALTALVQEAYGASPPAPLTIWCWPWHERDLQQLGVAA